MLRMIVRLVILVIVAGIVLFGLIQLVPYGRSHTDPPVAKEPNWDSPRTRQLAVIACFDCHSNQTTWPWYTNIAPFSWLIQRDVDEGRRRLNFSEWNIPQRGGREIGETVLRGSMPPIQYVIIHTNAILSQTDKEALAQGLQTTLANDPPGSTP